MDTRLATYLGQGDAAAKPVAPDVPDHLLALWYSQDTGKLEYWDTDTDSWKQLVEVDEAPLDATEYVRKDGAWEPLVIPPSGLEDAPVDGTEYLRKDGAWESPNYPTVDVTEAPEDGTLYGRKDGAWEAVPLPDGSGIEEAPIDGSEYVRKDGDWAVATGGGGGGGTPTDVGYELITEWDHAIHGTVAGVTSANLDDFTDIMVIGRNVTTSASTWRTIQVSTDDGVSFFTTSGDYKSISAAGVESNETGLYPHGTATTAARSFFCFMPGINLDSPLKPCDTPTRGVDSTIFVASSLPINRVKVNGAVGSGANLTGGTIRIYGKRKEAIAGSAPVTNAPWWFNPPAAADFPTLISGDANLPILSDDPDVGLIVENGQVVLGDIGRFAFKALPADGVNWQVTARITPSGPQFQYLGWGLYCQDSVGGSHISIQWTTGGGISQLQGRRGTNTGFLANGTSSTNVGFLPAFLRLRYVHNADPAVARYYYEYSYDGKHFVSLGSYAKNVFGANRADRIGFGFLNVNNTAGVRTALSCDHWEQSW